MKLWKKFTQYLTVVLFGPALNDDGSNDQIRLKIEHAQPSPVPITSVDLVAEPSCNSPGNRACWTSGFNIDTDYELSTPDGVLREYWFDITNGVIAPDGYQVERLLVNKSYPGPLIEGNWGDTFRKFCIHVKNSLSNHNGTGIHWHGIRQLGTNWMDGTPGITECPIPPGEWGVYEWRAVQYGVSWYHSHFSLQYADGIVGPIKINGPTSMNYDIDLGPVLLTDNFHRTASSQVQLEYLGRPPTPDSYLLNGNGTYYCCPRLNANCTGDSKITTFYFEQGKTHKFSLVNTATATHMTFWIDNHDFYVVGTDFVPIKPYPASIINVAIGQRYDIIVKANASLERDTDFWINARDCSVGGARSNLGIIRYNSSSTHIPHVPPPDKNHICYGCEDELLSDLVPIVRRDVKLPDPYELERSSLRVRLIPYPDEFNNASQMHKWVLKDTSLYLDWQMPSLSLINVAAEKNWSLPKFPPAYQPIYLNGSDDTWVYFLIEGKFNNTSHGEKIYAKQAPVTHPMHLHGHDFVVLAQANDTFDPSKVKFTHQNPPRRDVALLPVNGYLIIAFQLNNPGAWLLHCHIAWHASGGLALQFIENYSKLADLFRRSGQIDRFSRTCVNWAAYYTLYNKNDGALQDDSGI
ncbi:multicopper oxidase [Myriangium duriaei CBS 260.36]|uniref:Multicopper oxidase n=1 Tax=Myriangium duriaei CBS 260.36 TaxID=1168546 RepID=A0A9P4J156_9PEZI|nr:multicopper oxidase [Myriangium duriaei CBS 260.36]